MGVIEASDRAWKGVQMTNERHGTAEWLREMSQLLRTLGKFNCKDLMTDEFGISSPCDGRRCRDCYADMFERIADRIDAERALPEGMEWPRFEDGGLVRIGDELEFEGKTMLVCDATLYADGWALWCDREDMSGRLYGKYGERVKRPAPEVLDADGVPIKVGDVVYFVADDDGALIVECIDVSGEKPVVDLVYSDDRGTWHLVDPKKLTHERPDSWERIEEDAKLAPRDYLEKRGMNPEKTERIASMMADLVRRAKALAKAGEGL